MEKLLIIIVVILKSILAFSDDIPIEKTGIQDSKSSFFSNESRLRDTEIKLAQVEERQKNYYQELRKELKSVDSKQYLILGILSFMGLGSAIMKGYELKRNGKAPITPSDAMLCLLFKKMGVDLNDLEKEGSNK